MRTQSSLFECTKSSTCVVLLTLAIVGCAGGNLDADQRSAAQTDVAPSAATLEGTPNSRRVNEVALASDASQRGSPGLAQQGPLVATTRVERYVTVKNGHLYRSGARLRQWGVNLQSGVFHTYAEIDNLVTRLQALGFNAVRLWPTAGTFYKISDLGTEPNSSVRGDGSDLDRFDYLVWKLGQAGMTIQMAMLHYLDLPMLRASRRAGVTELVSSMTADADLRRLHGIAPYISAAYRGMLKEHIRWALSRVNPYSGQRYADEPAVSVWELANESTFVTCATSDACTGALPPAVRDVLTRAWQESPLNADGSALPTTLQGGTDSKTIAYRKFVAKTFVEVSSELREFARGVGGIDSGIAVQPFVFSTGPGNAVASAHYAHGAGDVFSGAAYHSPLSKTNGLDGSPWRPISLGGPTVPFLEYAKIEGKPITIYESSFFRPYPYRAEWGPVMAAFAIQQDWDGVFLYTYGQPPTIYSDEGRDSGYGTKPLAEPASGASGGLGDYTFGFHHGSDPVAMASWSIGAGLFLGTSGTDEAMPRAVWDLPLDRAFGPGHGYPPDFLLPENRLDLPRTRAVAVRFVDSLGAVACSPCLAGTPGTTGTAKVMWDKSAGFLRVETPGGTAVAGQLKDALGALGAGVNASSKSPGFGVVARLSAGSSSGRRATLYVLGNVVNTGMVFDPALVDFSSPAGAVSGALARGGMPLVFSGPTVSFSFSIPIEGLQEAPFSLIASKMPEISPTYTLPATRGVFRSELSFVR